PVEPAVIAESERASLTALGRQSLAAGEWASLVFAGGAGTRFRSQVPKGLFPLTPVRELPFLELFAAEALAAGVGCGRMPVLVLMTSSSTGTQIREWMAEATLQGLPKEALVELRQAEHPRLDGDGDLIADERGHVVVTGDGHGGAYRALLQGPAERLREAGIRSLVLHNVDNAAARPFEPARLGRHRGSGRQLTLTVVARARVDEKVGLVCRHRQSGRVEVVEYSVCPPAVAEAADSSGRPVFRLAHVNTNLVELAAVRADLPATLYTGKRVAVAGREVATSSLEMLNQHLSSVLEPGRVGVVLVGREEYFLPTKSLEGEDSLVETRAALSRAAAQRLRAAGAKVDETALIEIDPCVGKLDCTGWDIGPGARVALAVRHGAEGRPRFGPGLTVGRGSTLVVSAEMPYGRLRFDSGTRRIAEDPDSAGRVSIGAGVAVAGGAAVRVSAAAGRSVAVEDRATLR
ncbi:hypothetical protein FJY71_06575, partial [candidate division WOR-3 bacterium]|nr:hypothetical protein [candidate division WOR-3 bacterium]